MIMMVHAATSVLHMPIVYLFNDLSSGNPGLSKKREYVNEMYIL